MNKYLQFIKEFHNNSQKEIDFINNQLSKHLLDNQENQTEIETILDYIFSNPKTDISKIGYKTILEKTEKRHKKLQSVSSKDNEKEGVDYEVILDFKDGFKFVKLISKDCYNREGKLMSHCVASYYGRNVNVYSLRDKQNNPHCTIEENQQIKGKGNGKIDPKYINYVVKFLEKLGMTVGENEMKNLGYYKLDSIDEGLKCDKTYNGYIYENNLNLIKDKKGDSYYGLGILNIKDLITFEGDFKFNINIDISKTVSYIIQSISIISKLLNKSSDKNSAQLASSGDYAQLASSGDSAKLASSGDYAQLASSGDSAKLASSGDYAQLASSGDYAQLASSGYSAKLASSGYSAKLASSGDSAKLASSGYSAKLAIEGKYSVGANIGKTGIIKGIIGTRITLAEYDNYGNPICVKSAQIDGKKLKENMWYKLENKRFVEVK